MRPRVEILVNGQSLAHLIDAQFVEEDGDTSKCQYGGLLGAKDVYPPSEHFLGKPCSVFRFGDRTQVLCCSCGEWGCRPVVCRIEVRDGLVIWSDFAEPYRFRPQRFLSYEEVGPFVFEWTQYEEALEALATPDWRRYWEGPVRLRGFPGLKAKRWRRVGRRLGQRKRRSRRP